MSSEVGDLIIKWSGQEYVISGLVETDSIADLKDAVFKKTNVLPERQKLLGLKIKGKLPDKEVKLFTLQIKPKTKIMMMGTREEELAKVTEPPAVMPDVINDFDIEEDEIAIENREEFLAKIEKRIKDYEIKMLNEPREGKRLLVLDIDYTLFDHRSVAETPGELMRPYLHDFLKAAYLYYDIVIWSATGMKWIETKMNGLGVSTHTDYKICFYLDSDAMISVHTPKYGLIDVKPLGVIWGKFKQWSAANTIMFDDIRRNFIMNPQTGLRIRPFRKAHFNRDKDSELLKLMWYLEDITCENDFTVLNHKNWEKYKPKKKKSKKPAESEET